jgi:6,7-dimethyl-8-ribityllumazine synthase
MKKKIRERKLYTFSRYKIAIVVSEFNVEVTDGLLNGALGELSKNDVLPKAVKIFRCPGAFEIPQTARKLCKSKKYDAVICLGAVIKGETAHFEFISNAVSKGIMDLNLEFSIPVGFGVLTCLTEEQAIARSQNDENNKGAEATRAALDMIKLLKSIK